MESLVGLVVFGVLAALMIAGIVFLLTLVVALGFSLMGGTVEAETIPKHRAEVNS